MKLKLLAATAGIILSTSAFAETDLSAIEARLNALEQKANAAEARAAAAEKKAEKLEQMLAQQQKNKITNTKSINTNPPIANNNIEQRLAVLEKTTAQNTETVKNNNIFPVKTNYDDELKLYGDVEFNMDSASKAGQLTSAKTNADKKNEPWDRDVWSINGRILIGLDGQRTLDNGKYAGFSVQPMADMTGSMNVDDAAFFFGQKEDWQIKIGRYEAYDMFPLNQDTFIQYSGNTADDLYADGFGYIYMMKEGRGRSNHGGSIMVNKQLDNWYFELNALVEDGTALFIDSHYHGYELDNKKNAIYLRPVIAYQADQFKAAIAMESNVIKRAYGAKIDDSWQDMSKRNGYGLTLGWDNLEQDPINGVQLNLSTAYMDASNEKDFTIGTNALWRRLELGYIYANNDIKSYNPKVIEQLGNDPLLGEPGRYKIHTVFASYELPNILDMDNFKIYLGAYYSKINADQGNSVANSDDDRYGFRARFKYFY